MPLEVQRERNSRVVTPSWNYQRAIDLKSLAIPNDQSTSLYLTYIPPTASAGDVLANISEGGVYHYYQTGLEFGKFETCAAGLVSRLEIRLKTFGIEEMPQCKVLR